MSSLFGGVVYRELGQELGLVNNSFSKELVTSSLNQPEVIINFNSFQRTGHQTKFFPAEPVTSSISFQRVNE
jgi:hypothetical protein